MRQPLLPVTCLFVAIALGPGADAATRLPFEVERNRVVISARINGSRPLRLILDTGMVHGVLLRQPSLAEELGLEPTRKIIVEGAGDGAPIEADVAYGATVSIGPHSLRWQPVFVMPGDSTYSRMSRHLVADGIVGHSVFEQFIVEIDQDTRAVVLHPPDATISTDGATVLPLTIEGRKPYVRGRVVFADGATLEAKLAVDTGASNCLYLNPEADDSIRPPPNSLQTTLGIGVLGKRRGHVGRVRSLRLGPIEMADVITGFPDARIRGLSSDRHGLLGNALLGRFNATFDYAGKRLILRESERFDEPIEHDMLGIGFDPGLDPLEPFVVDEVLPGSPAGKAGIRVGDVLEAIDGRPVEQMTYSHVERMFRARDGVEYRLELRRGDGRVSVTVKLTRLI